MSFSFFFLVRDNNSQFTTIKHRVIDMEQNVNNQRKQSNQTNKSTHKSERLVAETSRKVKPAR
jgi:hypothetical protein